MKFKLIKTLEEYNEAIETLESLGDRPDFQEKEELIEQFELIAALVDLYEKKYFPIEAGDPIEIIKLKMDYLGIERKALTPLIGSSGVVSEVFNKKRGLSKKMIKNFSDLLNIDQSLLNAGYTSEISVTEKNSGKKLANKTSNIIATYNLGDKAINIKLNILSWEEANIHYIYSPALDITGHGNSINEAKRSFEISLKKFVDKADKEKTIFTELERLGWTTNEKKKRVTPPMEEQLLEDNETYKKLTKKPGIRYLQEDIKLALA